MQTQRSGHGNRKAYNTALVRVFSTPCSRHQGFLYQLTVLRALVVLADSLHLRPFLKPGVLPRLSACMCAYEVKVACVQQSRTKVCLTVSAGSAPAAAPPPPRPRSRPRLQRSPTIPPRLQQIRPQLRQSKKRPQAARQSQTMTPSVFLATSRGMHRAPGARSAGTVCLHTFAHTHTNTRHSDV